MAAENLCCPQLKANDTGDCQEVLQASGIAEKLQSQQLAVGGSHLKDYGKLFFAPFPSVTIGHGIMASPALPLFYSHKSLQNLNQNHPGEEIWEICL